jgi:hypothetical protein
VAAQDTFGNREATLYYGMNLFCKENPKEVLLLLVTIRVIQFSKETEQ